MSHLVCMPAALVQQRLILAIFDARQYNTAALGDDGLSRLRVDATINIAG